jgi:hypothetical protein
LNRYLEHDEHIGAGSVEICRATFVLDARKKGERKEKLISVEGKPDTCGSVSLSHSSHLQQVKDCRKYGLKEVVLSGIGEKSKPLRESACKDEYGRGEDNSLQQVRQACGKHGADSFIC